MMRSLYAGVSALRSHQLRMDVIGNNIANVNTIGYKASTVTFKELLSQTLRPASAPTAQLGGTNPVQVGTGVDLGAVTVVHTPGSHQATGVNSDVAVDGNGFFIVTDGTKNYYTRAGVFDFDRDGTLVSLVTGMKVLGYNLADPGGVQQLAPIVIPPDLSLPPVVTTELKVSGNLDARLLSGVDVPADSVRVDSSTGGAAYVRIVIEPGSQFNELTWRVEAAGGSVTGTPGIIQVDSTGTLQSGQNHTMQIQVGSDTFDVVLVGNNGIQFEIRQGANVIATITGTYRPARVAQTSLQVIDSRGERHDVFIEFVKQDENLWTWSALDANGTTIGGGQLTFDTTGALTAQTGDITFTPSAGANPLVIVPDFSGITQYAEASDVTKATHNGFPAGVLATLTVDTAGRIIGSFTNGVTKELAQLALASFVNPSGLLRTGASVFEATPNSGDPDIGLPGTGSRGTVKPGMLEASNVDLAQQFTDMIVTQRGFQANSRVITTTDEMLQELVNLKR